MTLKELEEKLKKKEGFIRPELIKNPTLNICGNTFYLLKWSPKDVIRFRVYRRKKNFLQEVWNSPIFSKGVKKYFSFSEIEYAKSEMKEYRQKVKKYMKDHSNA